MRESVLIAPVISGVVALVLGYVAMRMARKRAHMRDTPVSKAAGVFIGDVELKGTAESAEPLWSYLAELRCVHYTWLVEEHWRRVRTETYTDSKGARRTRTRVETGWDTVASGGEQIPFYLVDDSGHVLIRPSGMGIDGVEIFSHECRPGDPLYFGKGPSGSVSGSTERRRFTEAAIPIGAAIFVMGAARERNDVVAAEIAYARDARFSLVTMRTEEQVSRGYTGKTWTAGVFGALASVVGAGIAANGARLGNDSVFGVCVLAFVAYLIALACIWMVMAFNALRAQRERVRRGWANIDVELKRRFDLIPNIAESVKAARGHEAETQHVLTLLRAQYAVNPVDVREGRALVEGIAPMLVALREAYPDLKTSENFLALQNELVRTESRIALARTYYNGLVTAFNARIATAPTNLLARFGGLLPFAFIEAHGLEREVVKVEFVR